MAKTFSHTNKEGKARMVGVEDKEIVYRVAKASGKIIISMEALSLIKENAMKKGDVLTVAEIAGIQAAKRTAELIPLCHSLLLEKILVNASIEKDGVRVNSEVRCTGKTGVEMEALTAVSVALLTIYDMCKAVDKKMKIEKIELKEKTKC